jgi:LemA protein
MFRRTLLSIAISLALTACNPGQVSERQEAVQQAWREVQSLERQRADRVPSLVSAVRRTTPAERDLLDEVMRDRGRVLAAGAAESAVYDPEEFKRYRLAGDGLSLALRRLYEVVQRYPELKGNRP